MIYIKEKTTRKIPGKTSLFITFNYNANIVNAVKQCQPANYDKKTCTWEIPTTRLSKFINLVSGIDEIEITLLKDKKNTFNTYELMDYKTPPYDYQKEGIQYGLNNDSWLLLDCPGLGKTLQTIYLAQELKQRRGVEHCLVICGINTLKTNWEKEIKKHSNLDCVILGKKVNSKGTVSYGTIAERLQQLKSPINEFFVITNIETLRDANIVKAILKGKNKFDMIVVDEVHCCKSPTSQQSLSLLKLNNAKYKIAATGTLLLNSPLDAYVPLKWIGKDNSTYGNFKSQYCVYGGISGKEIVGYKNIDVLKEQIDSCSLRRTKDLLNLPEKNIIDEYLDMTDMQQKFYSDIEQGVLDEVDKVTINSTNLLSLIARLRQATACPSILTTQAIPSVKMERCCELVDEIVSNGSKVVVFSTFKQTLSELQKKLSKYNPDLCTGDIKDEIISSSIDSFQNDDNKKVILCTWQKMGTGITLTAADYAIFIDTPFTSGQYEQACDRIHRIGSTKPVFIYNLICNNTFDTRVREIVQSKEAIGDYVLDNKLDAKTFSILKQYILELKAT